MSKRVKQDSTGFNKVLIPIILLIGFVPLIVHQYQYRMNLTQFDWFPNGSDEHTEFFFGWKMIAIIVCGIIMATILVYRHYKKREKLRFENGIYPLLAYVMMVAMSALLSSYKYWVVHGTYELLEPIWVVFAYVLLCYYTYQYVTEEKQIKLILGWSGIGATIATLIGVFQYWGMDIFRSSFGKHLITNPSDWDKLDNFHFQVWDRVSYSTLYNQNFLSFYFGIMIPLIFCIIIAAKKWWIKGLLGILEVGCLVCLKGSNSDSSWIALTIGCVAAIFVFLSRKKKTLIIGGGVLIIVGVFIGGLVSKTSVGQQIITTIVGTYHMQDKVRLDGFDTEDNCVEFKIDGNKLKMSYSLDENQLVQIDCKDENGDEIEKILDDSDLSKYILTDSRFQGITLQPMWYGNDTLTIMVSIDGQDWSFTNVEGQGYFFYNPAGKLIKYHGVKSADLFREDAFSKRGRIWNLTIPLLGKHILVGSGANTFMFEYPQDDYIYHSYDIEGSTYDVKAHCWYLQQWIETGLIGTLALLIFIGWYVIQSIKIYRKANFNESISWIGFGLFAGILVYLVSGLANDSNVCTAPVFWGILGLGLAANRILTESEGSFAKGITVEHNADKPNATIKALAPNEESGKVNVEVVSNTLSSNKKESVSKKQSRKQRKKLKK